MCCDTTSLWVRCIVWQSVNRLKWIFCWSPVRALSHLIITTQPSYLHNLQPFHSTRSSSVVTLSRPTTVSSLKITDRSFRYASPRLWNQLLLPYLSCQPHHSCLSLRPHPLVNPSLIIPTLVIHHCFTFSLHAQNLPFQQILPTLDLFYPLDCLHDNGTGPDLSHSSVYF